MHLKSSKYNAIYVKFVSQLQVNHSQTYEANNNITDLQNIILTNIQSYTFTLCTVLLSIAPIQPVHMIMSIWA